MTVPATWLWLQTGEARMAIRRAASNCWKSRGIGKFKFQATNSRGHANKRACPLQDCPLHSLPARYELLSRLSRPPQHTRQSGLQIGVKKAIAQALEFAGIHPLACKE